MKNPKAIAGILVTLLSAIVALLASYSNGDFDKAPAPEVQTEEAAQQ